MLEKYLDKLEYNVIRDSLENECETFEGKKIASKLTPSSDEETVKKLLEETTSGCNLYHLRGSAPISQIDDMSLILKRIQSNILLNAKSLLDIAEILNTAKELKKYVANIDETEYSSISNLFNDLYVNDNIYEKICFSIISEDEISDNASKKLASIRRNKKNLELQIKSQLNKIIHSTTYSKYIMDPVITVRNDRYVVPVKEEYRNQVKGFVHDISQSKSTVYIEPMAVFEINNSINNLTIEEQNEIARILENLSEMVYPISNLIKQDVEIIGKLDFIFSKVKYAVNNDCTCPNITNYIEFKNARHPLIDKEKVVPITIEVGKKDFTTLVITGPNTGGKTVTLKTVGLLSAMAQSGMHIPVQEGSSIKVFDNIFADIGDEQSIEESLSTFSSHIKNIVQILSMFTEKSLILVDELGSGTDPIEGANLAISLLETFNKKGAFTIATTHYHEIKTYCLSHEGFENASCEFDIKKMQPTYHLLLGIPGKSNAFAICKELGISYEIIDRASSLISKPDTDIETIMKQMHDDKVEVEKIKIEEQKNLNQIELLRKDLQKEYSDKLQKEEEKIEESKKKAKEILVDAKEEANRIINNLSKLDSKDAKKANQLRSELDNDLNKFGGDNLDFSNLLKLNNKETKSLDKNNNSSVHIHNNKASTVSSEINLIGETVQDGCEILDKYLDNAKMANLKTVRVIHGKGSGKLREGIHKYLKNSKYVKDFHIASYGEGDYGVTIVELK